MQETEEIERERRYEAKRKTKRNDATRLDLSLLSKEPKSLSDLSHPIKSSSNPYRRLFKVVTITKAHPPPPSTLRSLPLPSARPYFLSSKGNNHPSTNAIISSTLAVLPPHFLVDLSPPSSSSDSGSGVIRDVGDEERARLWKGEASQRMRGEGWSRRRIGAVIEWDRAG